ncbi:MAG: Pvc16 family protein [Phormidesmis sp. CAN_BIN36]|nr:Pvc16 family protein [Phormidesmis sp. CAN_BIN36]
MSNALAIGAVTAVIKSLLDNRLNDPSVSSSLGSTVAVTVLAPDLVVSSNGELQEDKLNLYLYQVTPNIGWRNVGMPTRDDQGDRVSNPPLAIDLHYLLTAYSKEPFHTEMLLGYGMQLLHEIAVLTRNAIRSALLSLPVTSQILATAGLADQIEQIKICPQSMNPEEMSRLWSAFQSHYRPTAVYQASVVLIESQRPTKSALPVQQRQVFVLPFRQPIIEQVMSLEGANQPITLGSTLVIVGQQLLANSTKIRIGTVVLPILISSDTRVTLLLAAPPFAAGELDALRAGVQTVQIIQDLILNAQPHPGVESNVAAFVLHPKIVGAIALTPIQTDADGNSFRIATATLDVIVGQAQRVVLRLNQSGGDRAYSFTAAPRPSDAHAVSIRITDVVTGTYLVRVQVDGADSLLDVDTNPASPTFNQFLGTPNLVIS